MNTDTILCVIKQTLPFTNQPLTLTLHWVKTKSDRMTHYVDIMGFICSFFGYFTHVKMPY